MVCDIFNWISHFYFGMTSENTEVFLAIIDELHAENNADRAREISHQEHETQDVDTLVNLTDEFTHLKRFEDAIDIYARGCSLDTFREDHMMPFVNILAKKSEWPLDKRKMNFGPEVCYSCQGILLEPLTLPCGHTYCRNCLLYKNVSNVFCIKCNVKFTAEAVTKIKTNVTISNVLEKLWPREVNAAQLRIAGRNLCKRGDYTNGFLKYKEAEKLDPGDHLVQNSLCHALVAVGKQNEALEHAKKAINLHPTCFKVLYRIIKAQHAERSLNQEEETKCSESQNKQAVVTPKSHRCLTLSALCQEALKSQSQRRPGSRLWKKEKVKLQSILDTLETQLRSMKEASDSSRARSAPNEKIDKADFECSLCIRLFWQPVTTPCGHMFCRMCLDRCLDHKSHCPLCKCSLKEYLADRRGATTEFMEAIIERFLPDAHRERKRCYEEEMEELTTAGKDPAHGVPLFVCTMAYPDIACPLHVFEPRYRLMTRQCMESGTREFGMCALQQDETDGVARFGTMLAIKNITYYPDGRSIVDAIGCKRFRVLQTSMRDGYYVGSLEFIRDCPVSELEIQDLICLHDAVYSEVSEWFSVVPQQTRSVILSHFGALPSPEERYFLSANGPRWVWWTLAILPIGSETQIQILGMNSLKKRLKALRRLLSLVRRFGPQGTAGTD